jgi:Cu-Zn family superoxide dismutase
MFISLEGFAPNTIHAVHMHHGSCEQPKHHWNAGSEENFCNRRSLNVPWAKPYAGDVGNVSVGYDGTGSLTIKTNLWSIGSNDEKDILGLQVIVHEGYEDFTSECDPNHDHIHENDKLACGTIL